MTKMFRLVMVALALTAPVMAQGAAATQMESFYDCILPPTLAVYHDAIIASGHVASDVSFYQNKKPGASFNEASWLYALYAKKNMSRCKIPTDPEDAKKSLSIAKAAGAIIDGYILFTWSPTRLGLAKEWPNIKSGYDKIRSTIGNEYYKVSVPKGVINTDGKYDAMIHMQMAQVQ
ncbi:hypothetical protein Acife_1860 [Acidithiobacillus ferrivorans SS3]|uniref:Lipoprotein n=1 Tax=Acidithiobacillus ferrivorans SS3 TaxID=743299 RepID=G0JKY7_9PROT|nr:hypothetical protein [Acidithiobacillus ferrivorans]AEM47984.1 hypothetical protein Acife_1860 [Acidithiobacillus ferrivorans SS3]MBU2768825.1 hypothetical protein [Acidithiobacillus ferrivorans]MBU2851704.1 hypothetical protein [Acidithiobacillus ferrivorans]